jgi:hypothetical protein
MYPEALRFVSAATDSPKRKSYASVAKRVFGSVEIVHLWRKPFAADHNYNT